MLLKTASGHRGRDGGRHDASADRLLTIESRPSSSAWLRFASRRGRRTIQAYVSPTVRKQLHLMQLTKGRVIEALIMEGLDLVFRARGKPR
jgi:hypothetical protein